MSTERRLAAILAADVVGYSRLMETDEAGTLAALTAHRTALIEPAITNHSGRIVKLMGDGLLAEFASVVDAVHCAVAVQQGMELRNKEAENAKPIVLRIGINLGDVIIDGDDIHGDGVNIAARLEALAEPGGICVSGAVHEHILGKLDHSFVDGGEKSLKNIARPIHVWTWSGGTTAAAGSDAPLTLPDKPSIAVLPFANMSGDPEQEYFSDGIAEDVITALSRFHWFFVISRNSSFSYKGRTVDAKQTARELGVRYVLEGSVRKANDRVRIAVQLVDAVEDRHVWADRFDRVLDDVFAIQDEITQSIVATVAPEYLTAEMQRARRKEVPSLDAWELATRAHWHIAQFTTDDFAEARALLLKAVEIDPESSFGLSDLAFTHLSEAIYGLGGDPDAAIAKAIEIAQRAVAINNRDAYAYALLGAAALYSRQHDEAVRYLEQAIGINPNDPHAFAILGRTHIYLGDVERGIELAQHAIRLSPRDPMITLWYGILAIAEFVSGRYEESVRWAGTAIRAQPNRNAIYLDLAASCAMLGEHDRAADAGATFRRLTSNPARAVAERLHAFTRQADHDRYFDALRKAGLDV